MEERETGDEEVRTPLNRMRSTNLSLLTIGHPRALPLEAMRASEPVIWPPYPLDLSLGCRGPLSEPFSRMSSGLQWLMSMAHNELQAANSILLTNPFLLGELIRITQSSISSLPPPAISSMAHQGVVVTAYIFARLTTRWEADRATP